MLCLARHTPTQTVTDSPGLPIRNITGRPGGSIGSEGPGNHQRGHEGHGGRGGRGEHGRQPGGGSQN